MAALLHCSWHVKRSRPGEARALPRILSPCTTLIAGYPPTGDILNPHSRNLGPQNKDGSNAPNAMYEGSFPTGVLRPLKGPG